MEKGRPLRIHILGEDAALPEAAAQAPTFSMSQDHEDLAISIHCLERVGP